jgi:hypothetical protein
MGENMTSEKEISGHIKAAYIAGAFALLGAIIGGLFLILNTLVNNGVIVPPTNTETTMFTVTVPSNVYWFKTSIPIKAGQHITMQVTGTANTWGGTPQGNSDPNGNLVPLLCDDDACVLKNINYGVLVGKIGDGNPFKIGAYTEMVSVTSGEIQFVVNDKEGYYFDNLGEFEIKLSIR